jgi:hypothetical protein
MIVPETDEQVDPISYAPSLAKEIEKEYGRTAVEGLQKIGFKFEDEPSAGRSRRAQARAGATRHDLRAARREPPVVPRSRRRI